MLENDQIAEHVPGCNSGVSYGRRWRQSTALTQKYRKAGDDVDVCWRLQKEGMKISFAPGAFVWHHRRQNPRAYLRQQAGYGEAEGMLWFDHPDKFNGRGASQWHGRMYGAGLSGLRLTGPVIYRGTFGTGLFQTSTSPSPLIG